MLAAHALDRILGNEEDLCEYRKDDVFLKRKMTLHRGVKCGGDSTDGRPIRAAGAGFAGGEMAVAAVVIFGEDIGNGRNDAPYRNRVRLDRIRWIPKLISWLGDSANHRHD
jgi:hypothetical protein